MPLPPHSAPLFPPALHGQWRPPLPRRSHRSGTRRARAQRRAGTRRQCQCELTRCARVCRRVERADRCLTRNSLRHCCADSESDLRPSLSTHAAQARTPARRATWSQHIKQTRKELRRWLRASPDRSLRLTALGLFVSDSRSLFSVVALSPRRSRLILPHPTRPPPLSIPPLPFPLVRSGLNKVHHDNGHHNGHANGHGNHGAAAGAGVSLGMCLACRYKIDGCCNQCQAYRPPCDLCSSFMHGILDNVCGKLCGCGYTKSRETFRDCCGPCCAIDRWFCWLCDCCCAARGFNHGHHHGHPHGGPPGLAGGGPPGHQMH